MIKCDDNVVIMKRHVHCCGINTNHEIGHFKTTSSNRTSGLHSAYLPRLRLHPTTNAPYDDADLNMNLRKAFVNAGKVISNPNIYLHLPEDDALLQGIRIHRIPVL